MTSLREKLLKVCDEYAHDCEMWPLLSAVADVVEASRDVLTDIEKHMPGWRDEADAPEELTALERALAKLEQILNDARER